VTPPLQVFRDFRATGLGEMGEPRRPWTVVDILMLAVLIGIGIALVYVFHESLDRLYKWSRRGGGRFGVMVAFLPLLGIVTIVGLIFATWRQRGSEPFAYPVTLALPRWRTYRRDGAEAIFLTDGRGLLCLFESDEEDIEKVLDAIDPKNELEIDEAHDRDSITFDLAEPHCVGILRRLSHPRAHALVFIDNDDALDDLDGVLQKARHRQVGARPQKWAVLEQPKLAAARLRR
jgi:hypothetical protein